MSWLWIVSAFSAEVRLDAEETAKRAWNSAAEAVVARRRVAESSAGERVRPEDPQLRVRVKEVGSRLERTDWTFRLRQKVEPIGALRAEGQALRAGTAVEQAELAELEAVVVLEALERFDTVQLASLDVSLARQELALCEERLGLTEKRLEAGLSVSDDVIDAGVERMGAIRRVHESEVGLVRATESLAIRLNLAPEDTLVIEGPDLFEFALEEVPEGRARTNLAALDAEVALAEAERRVAVAEHRPFLDFVEAQVVTEPGNVARWGLAAAASLPVFSSSDGEVAAATARVERRQAERDAGIAEEGHRLRAARARLRASQTGLREIATAETAARARMAELVDAVRPDQRLKLEADLLQERRRSLDLVADILDSRRQIELTSTLETLHGGPSQVKEDP